jgi:hypothetical protein
MIARPVVAEGEDAERVATAIVDGLRAPDLRCAFVFADFRLDSNVIAAVTHRGLAPALVVGGTSHGVIASGPVKGMAAVGLGLYGDSMRFGVAMTSELSKSPLARSRDAVNAAADALGTAVEKLDPARHVGITILDGMSAAQEACCIGSAAAAPQIRFVGGAASTEWAVRKPFVWSRGEARNDASIILLMESGVPVHVLASQHLVPTDLKVVVTAADGRDISELDGFPAAQRLRDLAGRLGLDPDPRASQVSFARYLDGQPYVRSITDLVDDHVHVASGVEAGHVLRIMRPGDLIGRTKQDLAAAAAAVGDLSALLVFSCIGRHWEAAARGLERELGEAYAQYPTVGFQSAGEQSGMILCNHTLTGLAIGTRR